MMGFCSWKGGEEGKFRIDEEVGIAKKYQFI